MKINIKHRLKMMRRINRGIERRPNINHGLIVWRQPWLMKIIGEYARTDPRVKYPKQNKRRLINLEYFLDMRVYECPKCGVPMALFDEEWSWPLISYCGWGNHLTEEERSNRIDDCDQGAYCDECDPID